MLGLAWYRERRADLAVHGSMGRNEFTRFGIVSEPAGHDQPVGGFGVLGESQELSRSAGLMEPMRADITSMCPTATPSPRTPSTSSAISEVPMC
ncbi:hypothetical protein ACWDUN_27445 [Mycobacterium sp. NPDC003323]